MIPSTSQELGWDWRPRSRSRPSPASFSFNFILFCEEDSKSSPVRGNSRYQVEPRDFRSKHLNETSEIIRRGPARTDNFKFAFGFWKKKKRFDRAEQHTLLYKCRDWQRSGWLEERSAVSTIDVPVHDTGANRTNRGAIASSCRKRMTEAPLSCSLSRMQCSQSR